MLFRTSFFNAFWTIFAPKMGPPKTSFFHVFCIWGPLRPHMAPLGFFWARFGRFWGTFCPSLGYFWLPLVPFWLTFASSLTPLSVVFGHVGIIFGSPWHHLGLILVSFLGHLGIIFGLSWSHFWVTLESFSGHLWDHFGIILVSFWGHFRIICGVISVSFWDQSRVITESFRRHWVIQPLRAFRRAALYMKNRCNENLAHWFGFPFWLD